MHIMVEIKSVYGEEKVYPACKLAEGFAAIAGTKTLTEHTLRCIKQMGYRIEIKTPVRSWAKAA